MKIDKAKVFTIMYAIAIVGVISGILIALYCRTLAYTGGNLTYEQDKAFDALCIVSMSMLIMLLFVIILNAFKNDKFFWFEIAIALISVVAFIIVLAQFKQDMYLSTYIMVAFEAISTCLTLIIARVCAKFLKKDEGTQNEK